MANEPNHIFLPSVQPGVAASIPDQAKEALKINQPAALSLPLRLVVNSSPIDKTARLYGPGEITGIDTQQVVRVEPKHGTTDFEPNYFAGIEFDRPDFPWLFTPLKASDEGHLRPWLCLIVVRKQDGVELAAGLDHGLPALTIKSPAHPLDELPDLSESHLWVHAQVSGATREQLAGVLQSEPAKSVSRLLCPRRLEPATDYLACVVPAFEVGRAAGLNEATTATTLVPAWPARKAAPADPADPESIRLPVYYLWEFRTSAAGDFEELVGRLKPRELPEEVGRRPMDVSQPGFALNLPASVTEKDTTVDLEGALRVFGRKPADWSDTVRAAFQTGLQKILNEPWEIATQDKGDSDPIVGPPVYGCWHAANHLVRTTADSPTPWLDELNLDPRHRVIAGVGTRVVQDQQEQLMAAAWEQLGDIEVNQRLRQAQLSRSVNQKYHAKTFNNFSPVTFLSVVSSAQTQVQINEPGRGLHKVWLTQAMQRSTVPPSAASPPLRRLVRPRGVVSREFSRAKVQGVFRGFDVRAFTFRAAPANVAGGPITIDRISSEVGVTPNLSPSQKQLVASFRFSNLSGDKIRTMQPTFQANAALVTAVAAHHEYLARVCPAIAAAAGPEPIAPETLKQTILAGLDPVRTVPEAVTAGARLKAPNPLTGDELDPIMDAPEFPQPMFEALRDLSPEFLFPGLQFVPADTVRLLKSNAPFIESFMVGLNAEMGRELLWRNYPTDQRGTYFQHFWDTATAGANAPPDIPPIHRWRNQKLGTIATGAAGDNVVLLIRGELLRRYPGTVIYAVKAMMLNGKRVLASDHPAEAAAQHLPGPLELYPMFHGSMEPDVTFVGFDLSEKDVTPDPGWFFVLQQQPTEPRFGLDEFSLDSNGKPPAIQTWNDLNWSHIAANEDELKRFPYVRVRKVQLTANDAGKWGHNSAHMAYITKQLPARVAIHSSMLIKN